MLKANSRFTISTLAALAGTSSVFGFAEVGRGKLTANAQATVAYDSNIFANNTEQDDITGSFTPSLAYTRNVGRISSDVVAGVSAISFADTNGQDSVDPFVRANFRQDRAEKGSDSVSLSYARTTEANDVLLDRTESDEYRGSGNVDYYYSEKTGIRGNASYRISDYGTTGYNDVESYRLGGGVLYRYSPKLVANLGYSFSPEKATNRDPLRISNPTSKNHRFEASLEGEIAPKVTGVVSMGYAYREFDAGGSDDSAIGRVSLAWAAAEKTKVDLSISRDFDTTANAESARNLGINLGVRQSLTEKIAVSGSIGYQELSLDEVGTPVERDDEAYLFAVGASYRINDIVGTSASISHRINDSTLARADYDRTVVSLSVNVNF